MTKCEDCGKEITGRGKTNKCSRCVKIGSKRSEETKKKMSEWQIGKVLSEETRRKISEKVKGRPSAFKGRTHTTEVKKKLSELAKKRDQNNNPFYKMKFKGKDNGMYGRSVKDVWIKRYGKEKAEQMWREKYKNLGSKLSARFKILLEQWNYEYEEEYMLHDKETGANRFYDFYLPKFNLLIELDGYHFHHKDSTFPRIEERMQNDKYKNRLAKTQGYNLVRTWEDKIDIEWRMI